MPAKTTCQCHKLFNLNTSEFTSKEGQVGYYYVVKVMDKAANNIRDKEGEARLSCSCVKVTPALPMTLLYFDVSNSPSRCWDGVFTGAR